MSDNYGYTGYDDDEQDDNPVRQLRKANKEKDRQLAELKAELDSLRAATRESAVKDVLASKGLNSKIAKFIPPDVTSADEVAAWVEENADVFGGIPEQAASEGQTEPQQAAVHPDLAALDRIAATQSSGKPFSSDPSQILAQIAAANTEQELSMLLFGNPNGPMAS